MAAPLPPVPKPPPPTVRRFDATGRPTADQVTYETRLQAFLEAVRIALGAS